MTDDQSYNVDPWVTDDRMANKKKGIRSHEHLLSIEHQIKISNCPDLAD